MTNTEVIKLTVRAWLDKISRAYNACDGISEHIARINASLEAGGIDYTKEFVTGGKARDLADIVAKLEELRAELYADTLLYGADYEKARKVCLCTTHAWCVWLRYVEHYRLDSIAAKYGAKVPTVRKWIAAGYADIYERMPEVEKRNALPDAQEWEE